MKKSIVFLFAVCMFYGSPVHAQVSHLLNKVTKSVSDPKGKQEISKSTDKEAEPKCACERPELIVDLGGKLKLAYNELTIHIRDDGAILVKDRLSNDYYIIKDGVTQGPIKEGDSRLAGFVTNDDSKNSTTWANNEYITKNGDKYLIKFNGKSYGPYAEIRQFKVAKSKDKFAAYVVESVLFTEADNKKMEEAIKNAKTDQEKMDLSMQYSQEMAKKMQQGGGIMNTLPKIVTNIPGVTSDPMKPSSGVLNNDIKFDDILFKEYDKITDLSNKVILTLKPEMQSSEDIFVNTSNTKYAWYHYGTLTFGDGTVMSDLFNPRLLKANGQVNLAYMYYSPKSNAIMQCKMPF